MSATAKVLGCLRSNVLTILNILGVFSGVVVALILRASREDKWTQREIIYVGFIGKTGAPLTRSHLNSTTASLFHCSLSVSSFERSSNKGLVTVGIEPLASSIYRFRQLNSFNQPFKN